MCGQAAPSSVVQIELSASRACVGLYASAPTVGENAAQMRRSLLGQGYLRSNFAQQCGKLRGSLLFTLYHMYLPVHLAPLRSVIGGHVGGAKQGAFLYRAAGVGVRRAADLLVVLAPDEVGSPVVGVTDVHLAEFVEARRPCHLEAEEQRERVVLLRCPRRAAVGVEVPDCPQHRLEWVWNVVVDRERVLTVLRFVLTVLRVSLRPASMRATGLMSTTCLPQSRIALLQP